MSRISVFLASLVGAATLSPLAFGAEVNASHTNWMMFSSALLFLMIPGLAFYYGGLVRTKNVVSTLFQNWITFSMVGIFWGLFGYSLAFSGGNSFIGNFNYFFMNGVGQYAKDAMTIPHLSFMIFHTLLAIFSTSLISGAFAERAKPKFWMFFSLFWSLLIYAPVCHWVWNSHGWIAQMGGFDFAGGMVVHLTAGFSALVLAYFFGRRKDFGTEYRHHDMGMVAFGTALLFFGWFGLSGSSSFTSFGISSHAFATIFFCALTASLTWFLSSWWRTGKASFYALCSGTICGLVIITPAAGYVTLPIAMLMGFIGGFLCPFVANFVRGQLGIDDSMDVFACHGFGGLLGTIFTALWATTEVNSAGANGLFYGGTMLFKANFLGTFAIAFYSMFGTFSLIKIIGAMTTMRVSELEEEKGLDHSFYRETINSHYHSQDNHNTGNQAHRHHDSKHGRVA